MVALFQPESSDTIHAPVGKGQAFGAFTVGVAALLTLIVGIYPQPLIHLAQIALPVGF